MSTDTDDPRQRLRPEAAQKLAGFIRSNLGTLSQESIRLYDQRYSYSTHGGVQGDGIARWASSEYLSIARQLESGAVDPSEYESVGGDMVVQREPQLYSIDAFTESCLFHARIVARAIWEQYIGDTRTMNLLLATLEAFTQVRIQENLAAFAQELGRPRALSRTWQLRRGTEDPLAAGATAMQAEVSPQAGQDMEEGPFGRLTPREASIARLVAEGKTNTEVASALKLQLSTVKNTLSHIYGKLGVASRVELAILVNS